MVEPHPFVFLPSLIFVIPECPQRTLWVELTQRIRPTLLNQPCKGLSAFRLDERIIVQRSRGIDVLRGRYHVVVTREHHRNIGRDEPRRMTNQAFKPGQFVLEFRAGLRVSIRKVNRRDQNSLNSSLDIAGLLILRIARQIRSGEHRSLVSSKDVAFRELNSVSTGLLTLDIDDAVRRLEAQAAASEKSISLLGFNLPIAQLAQWGVLILLCVQTYFWLHLHELSSRIEPNAPGWDVAWIGIYRTRFAAVISTLSCFLMPVAAATILAYRFNMIGFYHHRTALAVSCAVVFISACIGFLTVRWLMKLRQSLPEAKEPFAYLDGD